MENNNIYPFPLRDLLSQPEYYMYSTYHGSAFLNEYLGQREAKAAVVEQQYLAGLIEQDYSSLSWLSDWRTKIEGSDGGWSREVKDIHVQYFAVNGKNQSLADLKPILKLDGAAYIYTESALRLLLQCAFTQDLAYRDAYLVWLNRFLKRYEVAKKLYSVYQPSMKAFGDDYGEKINYALLALVLLYEYEWSGNLKMLNTAIKLGDLLCSQNEKPVNPETFLVMVLAIKKEISLVRRLIVDKGAKI